MKNLIESLFNVVVIEASVSINPVLFIVLQFMR